MPRFLGNLFAFLLGLTVFVLGVGSRDNLDSSDNQNSNVVMLQGKSSLGPVDVVLLGNSYTYSGLIPAAFDELDLRVLNLGIATAGPRFYELIIDDYLQHAPARPRGVFVLLSPTTFSSQADNFVAYPMHRYLEQPIRHEALALRFGAAASYPSLLATSARKGVRSFVGAGVDVGDPGVLTRRGFVPSAAVFDEEHARDSASLYAGLRRDTFPAELPARLEKLLDGLERQGLTVVLYELPTHRLEGFFRDDYLAAYRATVERLGRTRPLYRAPRELPPDCFRNLDHLNTAGARVVTAALKRWLRDRPELLARLRGP